MAGEISFGEGISIDVTNLAGKISLDEGISIASPFLLDEFPGAGGAWSIHRKVKSGATLSLRVRRTDNQEKDINFSGRLMDVTGLLDFCAGTDGFVTVVYDQSGNGLNYTQTAMADQPKIVSSGSIITTDNGQATMDSEGLFKHLLLTGSGLDLFRNLADAQVYCVAQSNVADLGNIAAIFKAEEAVAFSGARIYLRTNTVSTTFIGANSRSPDGGPVNSILSDTVYGANVNRIYAMRADYPGGKLDLFQDGTQVATATIGGTANTSNTASQMINWMSADSTSAFDGKSSELIVYTDNTFDSDADVATINNNIIEAYS